MKPLLFAAFLLTALALPTSAPATEININQNAGLPVEAPSKIEALQKEMPPANLPPEVEKAAEDIVEKTGEDTAEVPTDASNLNTNDNIDTATRTKELARLEEYLNRLTTIVADFTQVAPDGSLSSGKFYLQRPGKMRWQYDPPTPILMIARNDAVVFYDYELEQVSHIPVDSTLATFLAKEKIDLHNPALSVDSVNMYPGVLRIILSQTGKPEQGSLTLEFADHPLQLKNMVVTDAQQQVTTVSLNNAQFGKKLDKSLFVFDDPRNKRK